MFYCFPIFIYFMFLLNTQYTASCPFHIYIFIGFFGLLGFEVFVIFCFRAIPRNDPNYVPRGHSYNPSKYIEDAED